MKRASVLMAFMGETTDVGVAELLSVLARRGLTGRLNINADGKEVLALLERGKVVQVTSSHHGTRLGRVLVRMGIVGEADLDVAVREQGTTQRGRPLGEILVAKGRTTRQDLARAAEEQATEALAQVFGAEHGTFFFTSEPTRDRRPGLVALNADGIVLEASRRADELVTLRRLLPPAAAVLTLVRENIPISGRMIESEQAIIRLVASGAITVEELLGQLRENEAAHCRALVNLRERGIIAVDSRVAGATESPQPGESVEPRTAEGIAKLVAGVQEWGTRTWAPTIAEVRSAPSSGSQTAARITRVVREVIAAFNAGLPLIAYAHFSDAYFRRLQAVTEDELEFLRHSSEPLPPEEQQTFIELRDPRALGNGRVSAIVITSLANGTEGKKVVIFSESAGVHQIEAIIESAQERERTTQTTILQPAGAMAAGFKSLRRRL